MLARSEILFTYPEAIDSMYQVCLVHLIKNITSYQMARSQSTAGLLAEKAKEYVMHAFEFEI